MSNVRFGMCPLCEASCGLEVEIDSNRIVSVMGDALDPMSRGHVCAKAHALADIHNDPDRVTSPMRRHGTAWQEVSWEEALDEVADRLHSVRTRHGRNAVGLYFGNPTAHSHTALLYGATLLGALGTRSYYTANSLDGLPRMLASALMYGAATLIPIPDLDRTNHLLILGANPVVSNGSLMVAPGIRTRLQELRARGARVVVVDPRRTETAALADEHHFIRPGGDVFLLLSMLHVILAEGLDRRGALPSVDGLSPIETAVERYTPERVADAIGMSEETIRVLARSFAQAEHAVCYGRLGACTQSFGTLCCWLIDVLNIVTGNFDRGGGAMFPRPAADVSAPLRRLGLTNNFGRWRSHGRSLPELNNEVPVGSLAADIETAGPDQVRALVLHAGNPVLSVPNGRRVERAIASLEFTVAIDIYINESTRLADVILPPSFGLERPQYPLLFAPMAVRNYAKYVDAIVEAPPGTRHDWEIMRDLSLRMLERRGALGRVAAAGTSAVSRFLEPEDILSTAIRLGPYGRGLNPLAKGLSLESLKANPHGVDLGPLTPWLLDFMRARKQVVDLAPRPLLEDLARAQAWLDASTEVAAVESSELLLIGRRDPRTNNSWLHNVDAMTRGRDRCTLVIHPGDAASRGIENGTRVRVGSKVGNVEVAAELSDEVMRGVVSLPHGWGHGRTGTKLSVANERPGASANDIIDDAWLDELSGCSVLSGVPVTVERA